jgi:MOSC domain-containing protein YiiM
VGQAWAMAEHRTREELDEFVAEVEAAPADGGTLELIVRRPAVGEREVLEVGELSLTAGLVGDTWDQRPSTRSVDGGPHPDMQLNVMSARVVAFLAQDPDRRAQAGDQLYLDLDLRHENLPAGTRLAIGTAVIEITDQPHTGCAKFTQRFGLDALRWVNSDEGKRLRLRGLNAKVVVPGTVRRGDRIAKVPDPAGAGLTSR